MPHTKTPGGQQASAKFTKQQAQTHGTGAPSNPDAKPVPAPGSAPVAGDSTVSDVGIERGSTQPGEKGLAEGALRQ